MEEYRVIFEWLGKPLRGTVVSDKMSLELAEIYYNEMQKQGYNPEILKVVKV
jgi:hypothetical protein